MPLPPAAVDTSFYTRSYRSSRGDETQTAHAAVLRASVSDEEILKVHPGFDGLEQVYALLPQKDTTGALAWRRVDLHYQGRRNQLDQYRALVDFVDPTVIREHGVQFGVNTNVGELLLHRFNM